MLYITVDKEILFGILIIHLIFIIIMTINLFKIRKNIELNDNTDYNIITTESAKEILEDLNNIIEKETNKIINQNFTLKGINHISSLDHSNLINKAKVISDKDIDEASIISTNKIISMLSDEYKRKLTTIIKEEKLEDYILEEVYTNLYMASTAINANTKK